MVLVWAEFTDSPSLQQFQNLKNHADRLGRWPAWREKALACMREQIAKEKRGARKHLWGWFAPADHSELVRVFLWEKDIETAWREAKDGGCSIDLWMNLAAKREKEHPEDALTVYQEQIAPTLARTNNDAYRQAVDLLRKINGLMGGLGRSQEFARYLESVRAAHKPKRNFMKLLAQAKWS
ncbi:MAG: hypothetical protein ACT4P2_00510 [Pseudomonadota bacterium]